MGGANAESSTDDRELRKRDDDALEDDGLDDVDMRRANRSSTTWTRWYRAVETAVPRITRDDVHDAFRAMVAHGARRLKPDALMQKMGFDEETMGKGVPHGERQTKDDEERTRGPRRFELEDDDDVPARRTARDRYLQRPPGTMGLQAQHAQPETTRA